MLGFGGWAWGATTGSDPKFLERRPIRSYRELEVWQSGMDLAAECYRLVKLMPKSEEFRIISRCFERPPRFRPILLKAG